MRKSIAAPLILRIAERTAEKREVPWEHLMSPHRESPDVAAARVLAMAVCCAAGVPPHTVAKAFQRTWQTVDSARERTVALCQANGDLCDEFIAILCTSIHP